MHKMTVKSEENNTQDDLYQICSSIRNNDLEGLKEILDASKKTRKMLKKTKIWREERGAIWNKAPLHLAAVSNNTQAIKILLDAGAQINSYLRWSSGFVATVKAKIKEETVLHSAIRLGKIETVKFLLSYGADPTLTGKSYDSIFSGNATSYAAQTGNIDLILAFKPLFKIDDLTGEKAPVNIEEESTNLASSLPSESTYVKLRDNNNKKSPYENVTLAKSLDQLNFEAAPHKPPRRLSQGGGFVSRSIANLEAAQSNSSLYPKLSSSFNDHEEEDEDEEMTKKLELEAALSLQLELLDAQEKWIQKREQINKDKMQLEEKLEALENQLTLEEKDFEKTCTQFRARAEFRSEAEIEAMMKHLKLNKEEKRKKLNCPACKRKIGHIYGCVKCDSMLCAVCTVALSKCYNCEQDFKQKPPKRNVLAERLL